MCCSLFTSGVVNISINLSPRCANPTHNPPKQRVCVWCAMCWRASSSCAYPIKLCKSFLASQHARPGAGGRAQTIAGGTHTATTTATTKKTSVLHKQTTQTSMVMFRQAGTHSDSRHHSTHTHTVVESSSSSSSLSQDQCDGDAAATRHRRII